MVGNRYTYGYYTGRSRPLANTHVQRPPHRADIHIVEKGETLYSIAFAYGEDVRTVARWNHIRPPYTIYPNQKLRLSPPPRRTSVTHPASARAAPPPVHARIKRRVTIKNANSSKHVTDQKISWQWPTNGKIISTYSATDVGKKGINIAGKLGQPIYAAASGEVVYSGDGLRGYGRLIIIKHNDAFFTAYAHNRRILVKDDQRVKKGQHIADMGSTEADRPMLHFEVRRDGKPVDPLKYLPRRH
ncbi:MAG: peptidoglycan DD-metalloendopeptidase family protein [Gammaproteobacteria bacterium]